MEKPRDWIVQLKLYDAGAQASYDDLLRPVTGADADGRPYVLIQGDPQNADLFLEQAKKVKSLDQPHQWLICGFKMAAPEDLWLMLLSCFRQDCWFPDQEEEF